MPTSGQEPLHPSAGVDRMRASGLLLAGAALVTLAGVAGWFAGIAHRERQEQANVALVKAMWDGVIGLGDQNAVMRYIAADYRQHNPNVAPGRDGVLQLASIIRNRTPGMVPPPRKTFNRAVAQGDLVVVLWDQPQPDPVAPGKTYPGQAFDMFRVKDGKLIEHWDDTRKVARAWRLDANQSNGVKERLQHDAR